MFLFSHMQDKLSKHSSQVDLLKELLNLQKDMITMMLSMLEGITNLTGIIFNQYEHFSRKCCKWHHRKADGRHISGKRVQC